MIHEYSFIGWKLFSMCTESKKFPRYKDIFHVITPDEEERVSQD